MNPGDLFCVCLLLAVSGCNAVYLIDYLFEVDDLRKRCRKAEGERGILLESVECLKNEGRRRQEAFEALEGRCRTLSGAIKSLEGDRDKLAVQNAALNGTLETYKKWESSRPGSAVSPIFTSIGLGSIKFGQ